MNWRDLLESAQAESEWDFANDVLYKLCESFPRHTKGSEIVAKVWLIGRAYAAAIERKRPKAKVGDNFYLGKVAPKIQKSDFDKWLASLDGVVSPSQDSMNQIIKVHGSVTQLFGRIAGSQKRSLASKYLHFHLPDLFYIYDSRAARGMQLLSETVGRAPKAKASSDSVYSAFAWRCLKLKEHVESEFNVSLTPRQLDNLLIEVSVYGRAPRAN